MAKRGRPPKIESEIRGDLAQMREQVTLKLFGLSEKVYRHLMISADAIKPCHACTVDKDGNHLPGKAKNAEGKCALCGGTYLVPDYQQRNWAATEALPLITQSKPVEMKIDAKAQLPELENQYKSLPDEAIRKLLSLVKQPEVIDAEVVKPESGTSEETSPPDDGAM